MEKTDPKTMRQHFIKSLYSTLDTVVSPTPYLEIKEEDNVDVTFLNGQGNLPMPNTTEVTVLDIDIASLFFDDFHILYEGVTGIGKTYTSDALLNTVFGPEGHHTLRLSGGLMGSSAIEPFTTTSLEGGIPKTRIDHDKCSKYGALFIDEINRGDSQEVFQIVDGVIHVNGDTGYLRLPIPETDRYKGVSIIAAMNPPDAEHSAALELDIAGENRFLKFKFPNGIAEAASSQLEKKVAGDLHEQFWEKFSKRSGLNGTWKEIFPAIADPKEFATELGSATREFIDLTLGYVGQDPIKTFDRNVELMQQGEVNPSFSIRKDNDYDKIINAQQTLKHGFVRRDLRKISDLSKLLRFIKGVKNNTYDSSVALNDVAASIGIILESKTITGTDPGGLMALVNDARSAYDGVQKSMNIPSDIGIRQAIWQSAIYAGQEEGFETYLNTLHQGVEQLNTQTRNNTAQLTLRSRALADLVVLEHFSKTHEKDITAALKESDEKAFTAFKDIYTNSKMRGSVYEHRLDSLLR